MSPLADHSSARRTRWIWLASVLVVGTGAAAASIDALGRPVTAAEQVTVGTSGKVEVARVAEDTSPATIHEIETITGEPDGHQLIGRRVDLHVPVQRIASGNAFWVGPRDNQVLVVLRHTPAIAGNHRAPGQHAEHQLTPVRMGQQALISGTILGVPNRSEDRQDWMLTDAQRRELADRPTYIRADAVRSQGHGTP